MPKIPGLQRRRLTYYIRVRVPQELVSVYKSKEVVRSLETRDYETACKRIHKQRAIIQSEFDEKLHQIKAAAKNPDMLSGYMPEDNKIAARVGRPSKTPDLVAVPALEKKEHLSIADVMEKTGIGRTKLYNEMKEGRLQANKCGRQTLISQENFRKWVEGFSRY